MQKPYNYEFKFTTNSKTITFLIAITLLGGGQAWKYHHSVCFRLDQRSIYEPVHPNPTSYCAAFGVIHNWVAKSFNAVFARQTHRRRRESWTWVADSTHQLAAVNKAVKTWLIRTLLYFVFSFFLLNSNSSKPIFAYTKDRINLF